MLEDLLKVKRLREDDAVRALAKAKDELERLQAERDRKQREHADYQLWRPAEERRLHERIQGRKVKLEKVELLRETIAGLRQRELQLQEACADAQQAVRAASEKHAQAHRKRLDAHKDVVKFEELDRVHVETARREAELRQEVEIEDFVPRGPSI